MGFFWSLNCVLFMCTNARTEIKRINIDLVDCSYFVNDTKTPLIYFKYNDHELEYKNVIYVPFNASFK